MTIYALGPRKAGPAYALMKGGRFVCDLSCPAEPADAQRIVDALNLMEDLAGRPFAFVKDWAGGYVERARKIRDS